MWSITQSKPAFNCHFDNPRDEMEEIQTLFASDKMGLDMTSKKSQGGQW